MATVPTGFGDLSTTAASNYPAASDAVFPNLDDALRIVYAMLASIYANTSTNGWTSPFVGTASPTFTGQCSFPDGASASAPAIANTGDLNTGLWWPAADTVELVSGGTGRLRVDTTVELGDTGTVHVTDDGRLYGTALHNNAGAVTGTTNQYVASGTYTPTLTNTASISGSTARLAQWIRVGNVVTVSGAAELVQSADAVAELGISLPIASNFANIFECNGLIVNQQHSTQIAKTGSIYADAANNRATAEYYTNGTGTQEFIWHFTYQVI